MHEKNIKRLVKKQLKQPFPRWSRLRRKEKKALAKGVLEEVVKGYCFEEEERVVPRNELLGIPDVADTGIMTLREMEVFMPSPGNREF